MTDHSTATIETDTATPSTKLDTPSTAALVPQAPTAATRTTVEDVEDQDEIHPTVTGASGSAPDQPEPVLEEVPPAEGRVAAPEPAAVSTSPTPVPNSEPTSPVTSGSKPEAEKPEQLENGVGCGSEDKAEGPFIRPYDSSRDYDDLLDICIQTASPGLRSLPPLLKPLISSIWCKPYLLFCPSTCFVLHDPTLDKPVGYIIGTPSTLEFVKTYKDNYLPLVDVQWPHPDSEEVGDMIKAGELKEDLLWVLKEIYNPDKMVTELVVNHPASTEGVNSSEPGATNTITAPTETHTEQDEDKTIYPAHLHIDILPSHQGKCYGPKLLSTFEEKLRSLGVTGVHLGMDPANDAAARWYVRMGFTERKIKGGGRWMVKKFV